MLLVRTWFGFFDQLEGVWSKVFISVLVFQVSAVLQTV